MKKFRILLMIMAVGVMFFLAACNSNDEPTDTEPNVTENNTETEIAPETEIIPDETEDDVASLFTPGTFSGVSESGGGHYVNQGQDSPGQVYVDVTVDENSIVSIEVTAYHDTPNWFARVNPDLINTIIAEQSTSVDGISGATYSSIALIEAIEDALNQARR